MSARHLLLPKQRLIVAADFKPTELDHDVQWVRRQVLQLAEELAELGVLLKVNAALRACGYGLIDEIHSFGLGVFADLKLNDIADTLAIDAALLRPYRPELLTTVCTTGRKAMSALREALPNTEVLGVTVLTDHSEDDAQEMFSCSIREAVLRLAHTVKVAGLGGLICSGDEAKALRDEFGDIFTLNTPAIRPLFSVVPGDGQNPDRIMTPMKAIKNGADRLVIGRPIVRPPAGVTRREAAIRVIAEIAKAAA